jgi:uncharacterized membrane protein HdeD (DUF308 family)
MSTEVPSAPAATAPSPFSTGEQLNQEFRHVRSGWWCFLLLGILLVVGGTAAIVFPLLTVVTTLVSTVILGAILMVTGIATIIMAFWAGKWSGVLLQLLCGILYVISGYVIADHPVQSAVLLTGVMAIFFILIGAFRSVAALVIRFPHWGWALLNGVVTFLAGVIIYRHFPEDVLWVIGLLIGLEMLFHGWTWIMLSLAVRNIPAKAA